MKKTDHFLDEAPEPSDSSLLLTASMVPVFLEIHITLKSFIF